MRVRVRPGGLASFGLRVSSDCDDARIDWYVVFAATAAIYFYFYETPSQV